MRVPVLSVGCGTASRPNCREPADNYISCHPGGSNGKRNCYSNGKTFRIADTTRALAKNLMGAVPAKGKRAHNSTCSNNNSYFLSNLHPYKKRGLQIPFPWSRAIIPTCSAAGCGHHPQPRPVITVLPAYAILRRSLTGIPSSLCPQSSAQPGFTGKEWLINSKISSTKMRISAGTRFPDSRRTISPGTSSSAEICSRFPLYPDIIFRMVCSCDALCSAFHSWMVPITALIITTRK